MKTVVVENTRFDTIAAQYIVRAVLEKPDCTICFATGDTTSAIFDEIVRIKDEFGIDFSGMHAVNLDEYVGVDPEDPAGCHWRVRQNLYGPLGLRPEQYYVPSAPDGDGAAACVCFKQTLDILGGIDLMLLSVGQNGHIAFNEPGTPFGLGVHLAPITDSTKEAKKELFGGKEHVPSSGVSMGIADVMQAKSILFVAKGDHKADIVAQALLGTVTEAVPASVLQLHPNMTVLLDKAAAMKLERREVYLYATK